jgi:hypothetical protein
MKVLVDTNILLSAALRDRKRQTGIVKLIAIPDGVAVRLFAERLWLRVTNCGSCCRLLIDNPDHLHVVILTAAHGAAEPQDDGFAVPTLARAPGK